MIQFKSYHIDLILSGVKANGVAGEDKCVAPGCGKSGTNDWYELDGISGPCCRWAICDGDRS